MWRVLNISGFSIFVNFRKYDRILNVFRDVIMEELWMFQELEYVGFLHIPALHKVLNMPEHG